MTGQKFRKSGAFHCVDAWSELVGYQSALVLFPVQVFPVFFQVHRILREGENTPEPVQRMIIQAGSLRCRYKI